MTKTRISQQSGLKKVAYLCAVFLFLAATATGSAAQTFNSFYEFTNNNGAIPMGTLAQGSDGNFYGTTYQGGDLNACQLNGCGTIFQLTPAGAVMPLGAFSDAGSGTNPNGGLVQINGVLYGTAARGGNINTSAGTIFSVHQDGTGFTVIYTFTGGSDGAVPLAGLLVGQDGNLYGTTSQGGQGQNTTCVPNGCGTIFSLAPDGSNFKTLYQFFGGNQSSGGPMDGESPQAPLIQDPSGLLYGTTHNGGAACSINLTCGTVFSFQISSSTLTTLHSFNGTTDGAAIDSPVVRASNGTFYGTAQAGGNLNCGVNLALAGCGTIFSITRTTFNLIWTFQGSQNTPAPDGAQPFVGLTIGSDGNLYGTTVYGGAVAGQCTTAAGCGTIFSVPPVGGTGPTILHSFSVTDGWGPHAGLLETNGIFYGTTASGGSTSCGLVEGCGTVFSLTAPSSGKTSTTTNVMVTPSSITQGSNSGVMLSATVNPNSGSGTPSGTVTFFNGTAQLGQSDPLSAGMASFAYNTNSLAAGTYSITAVYSGDSNFNTSTSSRATLTVSPNSSLIPTATSLTIQASPSTSQADVGSSVSFTAAITHGTGSANPGGTVTFTNGSKVLGTATVTAGTAVFSTTSLVVGQYSVTATYSGDTNYSGSASSASNLSVVDFQLSATPTSITISSPGQSGSAALTLTPLDGFNQTVSFACSGLPNGASCSFANTSTGATMSVSTAACTTNAEQKTRGNNLFYALMLPGLVGFVPAGSRKRNLQRIRVLFLVLAMGLTAVCIGCGGLSLGTGSTGGGGCTGTSTGNSTITVTATAGAITHSTTIMLNVQ